MGSDRGHAIQTRFSCFPALELPCPKDVGIHCILGVTHPFAPTGFAGLAIGLTLVVIHLVGINITGTSVNPARSIGPALVGVASNPSAVAQLWLFIIAPLIGAGAAGILFRESALLDAPRKA